MKKVILLVLLVLVFNIVGCGTDDVESAVSTTFETDDVTVPTEQIDEGVTYTLEVNEEVITENKVSAPAGDIVVSLVTRISQAVSYRIVEGDFLSTGSHEAILEVDYPAEVTGRDGTVVSSHEYHMKDIPAGQVIHVTITKELQERLGLESDVIEIICE